MIRTIVAQLLMPLRRSLTIGGTLLTLGACSTASLVTTPDQWYPNYGPFRVAPDKQIVVYVHGYGGSEETFHIVPYLQASLSQDGAITILYFNYDTGALRANLQSFGQISEQLRDFLESRIFKLRGTYSKRGPIVPQLTVICHSTGCPIVKTYVSNNPGRHGIANLITVAGANYGAYYAESASAIKREIPLLQGDKQINELRYGSTSLAALQQRLHHEYMRCGSDASQNCTDLQNADAYLKHTPFSSFRCKEGLAENHECFGTPVLPRTIAILGSNRWTKDGPRRYSDGVIRAESALSDCRFLSIVPEIPASTRWSKVAKDLLTFPELDGDATMQQCGNRIVLVLPCAHTAMFSDPKCLGPIVSLVDYVLQIDKKRTVTPGSEAHAIKEELERVESHGKKLAEAKGCQPGAPLKYEFPESGDGVGGFETAWKVYLLKCDYQMSRKRAEQYIHDLDMGALWIRVRYYGLHGAELPGNAERFAKAVSSISTSLSSDPDEGRVPVKRAPHAVAALIESDFTDAIRTSTLQPERMFYYKYLSPGDIYVRVTVGDEPMAFRMVGPSTSAMQDSKSLRVRIRKAQTTIVLCEGSGDLLYRGRPRPWPARTLLCINVTEDPS